MSLTKSAKPPIPMGLLEQCADALRVLAHPHRLKLVELMMGERLSVGELADRTGLAANAVSQHLSQMKAHGILAVKRDGRTAYYRVVNPNAKNLIRCIRRFGHGRG